MPAWLKVILIILAFIIVLVVAAVYTFHHWIETHRGELKARGEKINAEAAAFGKNKTPEACVAEALARAGRCNNAICQAMERVFLSRCVAASNVPENFCASIPSRAHFIDTAKWTLAECAHRGFTTDQRCTNVIAGLQDYCEKR